MKYSLALLLLCSCSNSLQAAEPADGGEYDLDICDLDVLAPRQIGGLGARSDTARTTAIYQYVDKTACGPWCYQCGDNLMTITCHNHTELWSLHGVSIVSGYRATLQVVENQQVVDTERLSLGQADKDGAQP